MTTETKPTIMLPMTLPEAKALADILTYRARHWDWAALDNKVAQASRLPKALRQAIKEAK